MRSAQRRMIARRAECPACASLLREARERDTHKAKARQSGGAAFPTGGRENSLFGDKSFPESSKNRKRLLATGEFCPVHTAPGGLLQQPGRPLCCHSSPSPST